MATPLTELQLKKENKNVVHELFPEKVSLLQ